MGSIEGDWPAAHTAWLKTLRNENTRQTYERALEAWISFLASEGLGLAQVTTDEVEAYRDALLTVGKSPATINLNLAAVRLFYKHCERAGLTTSNPARGVKRLDTPERVRKLEPEDLPVVLKSIPRRSTTGKRDYALVLYFAYTRQRLGEIAEMNRCDLHSSRLPGPVMQAIEAYWTATGQPRSSGLPVWVAITGSAGRLPNVSSSVSKWSRLSSHSLGRIIKRRASAALKRDVTARDVRQAAAELLLRAGGNNALFLDRLLGESETFGRENRVMVPSQSEAIRIAAGGLRELARELDSPVLKSLRDELTFWIGYLESAG